MELIKKKRERDSKVAKAVILAAAEEIFARDGFGAARIDAIAALSGYNKSLIFQYFEDKLGLYRAVVQCSKDQMYDEVLQELSNATETPDALTHEGFRAFLEKVIRANFNFYIAHPRILRIQAWEIAEGWRTFSTFGMQQDKRRHIDAVRRFLQLAREAGIIRAEINPDRLFVNILGMCTIYILSIPRYQALFADTDFTSPEALAEGREQIISIVLNGIMAQPKETTHAAGLPLAGDYCDRPGIIHGDPR